MSGPIRYELPTQWKWFAFAGAFEDISRLGGKIQKDDYKLHGRYPIVDQGKSDIGGYTDDDSSLFKGELPVIVFGDHTRAVKYVDFQFVRGADGTRLLKPMPDLDAEFAYYYLRSVKLKELGYSRHFKLLKEISVPVAPLDEQRHIVDILKRADGIRRLRKQAIQTARELIPALFVDMFGDPATNPKGWERIPFSTVGTLDRGKSKHRPRNDPVLFGGPYPFIQTGEVTNSGGRIRRFSTTYSEQGLAQSRLWTKGTLCITIAANIAETGVLEFDACFPDSVVGFLPGPRVTTDFVQAWLAFLQPTLEANAPQLAQKNINLKILGELPIPIPPIDLQQEFSRRRESVESVIGMQSASDQQSDVVFQSILHRAFRGEL